MTPTEPHKGALLRWLHGPEHGRFGLDPADFDPAAVERWLARLEHVFGPGRWFGLDVDGWRHLPPAPVMLVGNHSGGTTIPDVWGLTYAWYRHFGTSRPLHPLAHEMVFALRNPGVEFARLGVMRAQRGVAERVLVEHRRDALVLPGGDIDTWRPWSRRHEISFGGRTGYARTALRSGVPIVPVAHVGAHDTLLVLTDGKRFAKAVGLPRIARASIFPVHLSLPFGLTVGPTPHVPVPTTLRYRFGRPIQLVAGPVADPTPEQVAALDHAVREELQRLLDEIVAERAPLGRRMARRARAMGRRLARRVHEPAAHPSA